MSAGNGNSSTIEIAQSEQVIDTKKKYFKFNQSNQKISFAGFH